MHRLLSVSLVAAVLSLTEGTSTDFSPCVPQKFNHDSVVCVCNATYCDSLPPLPAPADDSVTIVTSSSAGRRFSVSSAAWKPESRADNYIIRPPSLSVNPTVTKQTVLGFGGAFTDAAGINIGKLPEDAQRRLIGSYYGNGSIRYSIARVPIGGCDFSTRPYSYDDGDEDPSLANFLLTEEDRDYKISYLQQALKLTPGLRVFGSPWSAPAWMKTNNALNGQGVLKKEFYQTWADYYMKFLDAYDKAGIPIWGLTMQNEPVDGLVPDFTFNCMGWTAETQGAWVRDHLGPTLRQSRFNATKVMILDDQREFLPAWPDAVLSDPDTAQYVDGIAVHWYGDPFFPAEVLTLTHNAHPDKFLLNTEACEGSLPWELNKVALGSWQRAQTYAADIIQDLNHWVTGWVDWNIALDMNGGPNWVSNFVDSPIIVDAELARFYKQPMYYAMGHFAAFIPPGSTVVEVGEQMKDVPATAAVTPEGHVVAVLLNTADHVTDVTVSDPDRGHLDLELPARSISTLQWKQKQ